MAIVVVLAAMTAWVATQRAFRPIRALGETARAITRSDLSRRLPLAGDAERTIGLVIDELSRGSRIVEELRLLGEAELPEFLKVKTVELGALTDALLAKAQALAPRAWWLEARAAGTVLADRDRLTEAVMNLAENAAHHTEEGAPIGIGSAVAPDGVRLWVRDHGPGVPEEHRDRIFAPFERGPGAQRRYRGAGLGLGLAIVRAVAEAHGGHVELSVDDGTCFTVVLPQREPR